MACSHPSESIASVIVAAAATSVVASSPSPSSSVSHARATRKGNGTVRRVLGHVHHCRKGRCDVEAQATVAPTTAHATTATQPPVDTWPSLGSLLSALAVPLMPPSKSNHSCTVRGGGGGAGRVAAAAAAVAAVAVVVGVSVGTAEGGLAAWVGVPDGCLVILGDTVGLAVGSFVGLAVGLAVGLTVGLAVGLTVGSPVGLAVGDHVHVGLVEGRSVVHTAGPAQHRAVAMVALVAATHTGTPGS